MKLDHSTPIAAIQELANNTAAVASDLDYPWEAASRLKRFLIEDGHTDTDEISETALTFLARAALRYQPEPDTLSDLDSHGQHEHFTPAR